MRIDLDKALWDQRTFTGRFKYFAWITDPRLTFTSTSSLLEAKELLQKYRCQEELQGVKVEQVRRAQQLYLSAFHPDSGELQNVVGRMSFQVPGGMILIGAMITFYRSTPAVIFWQWTNQSFNAFVNYTNRNAASDIPVSRLAVAYVSATSCAVATALGLKKYLAVRASSLVQRLVPFVAVAAANMVNIPLMRQSEIINGVAVYDENQNKLTTSKVAAVKGISQVVFSRILMAAPSMTLLPIVMEKLEQTALLKRFALINAPLQVLFSGLILLFMVPGCCAIFPQRCGLSPEWLKQLEPEKYEELKKSCGINLPECVYFNKGL